VQFLQLIAVVMRPTWWIWYRRSVSCLVEYFVLGKFLWQRPHLIFGGTGTP
jgi:hypothetical protein